MWNSLSTNFHQMPFANTKLYVRLTKPTWWYGWLRCVAPRPDNHWSSSLHNFKTVSVLSGTDEQVQLYCHCYVEYLKDQSLGWYCSFCIRQTSLDSLNVCNYIPTSSRTTFYLFFYLRDVERPQHSDSAFQHGVDASEPPAAEYFRLPSMVFPA